jgi:hypothetical protein
MRTIEKKNDFYMSDRLHKWPADNQWPDQHCNQDTSIFVLMWTESAARRREVERREKNRCFSFDLMLMMQDCKNPWSKIFWVQLVKAITGNVMDVSN